MRGVFIYSSPGKELSVHLCVGINEAHQTTLDFTPKQAIEHGRKLILEAQKLQAEKIAEDRAHKIAMKVIPMLSAFGRSDNNT